MIETAREVLRQEAEAIQHIAERLDESFTTAVRLILGCRGRVVVTGIGKSGIICRKIAATLASTGTPAFFLHAGDAIHGDLGMIVAGDLVLALSNSGQTFEILRLLPRLKERDIKIIAVTGEPDSELAKASTVVLTVDIRAEACPMGLAPTTSTTAALALGDALAIALLEIRDFRETDFADLHPGGKLGRKLLRVEQLMRHGAELPVVHTGTLMKDVLVEMTSKGLGVTTVVDDDSRLAGIITDGDLRRALTTGADMLEQPAAAYMTTSPKLIDRGELASVAMNFMEAHTITCLIVTDMDGRPEGILKLHDILKRPPA
ncbi:KpsF/GutQ family sugar-phosphate isomerase [bacterium]|nr:KpsF/GutQ family sugar-phosphate isomerase [candidate division CSSED10-310 bacterium]